MLTNAEAIRDHHDDVERALYPAGDTGPSPLLVRAMRNEHRDLIGRVEALTNAQDMTQAMATTSAILAIFESHLTIPTAAADPGVTLAQLLDGMHGILGGMTAA